MGSKNGVGDANQEDITLPLTEKKHKKEKG